ncbi:hypothetical protein C475_19758 [Halosimplex carlsbadense 2-9-1]|uniref:Uncharacterized protein n=1 Tax=Halosimplex carlsbadense 2-9-1 TaxID=797114 RepID=M0CG60_9EURY|nr:hypothetical protein [Halosimplex carlsbadense]ELZ20869.1 hypothetical protein C475_19758 [Halosimplex carlsbadense 2-9-1]
MLDPLLIPVDWVVDYEPAWLGPAVLLLGAVLLAVSYVRHNEGETLGIGVIVFAASLAALPWAFQNQTLVVAVLSLTGSWFQGVGTVRAYLKIRYYAGRARAALRSLPAKLVALVRSGPQTGSSGGGSLPAVDTVGWWLLFQLLGLLALLMSVWIGFGLTLFGPLTIPSLTTDIVITWTLVTAFGGVLGLGWRFWSVRESFPGAALLGVICLAVGAELSNVRALETEILLFFAAKAAYALGFLGAVAVLTLSTTDQATQTDTHGGISGD